MQARGISIETARRYLIGFDPASNPGNLSGHSLHPMPRLIVPSDKSFYFGRSVVDTDKRFKKINPKGSVSTVFNLKTLSKPNDVIFVVEGVFDALSVIEAGGGAVALNSTSNAGKFLEVAKD